MSTPTTRRPSRRLHVHLAAALVDLARDRAPHHPRPLPRVLELLDERLDGGLGLEEHAQERGLQRQVLDALRGPLGLQLRAGDAPDLLGVGLEEGQEEAPPEAVGHPLLEGVLDLAGEHRPAQVAEADQDALDEAEAHQRVQRLERVVEELLLVVDAREARPLEELVGQDLLPHLVDLHRLGEEAVAAHVEVEVLVLLGAGDAADGVRLLEDLRRVAQLDQVVRGGQAGGPSAHDHELALGCVLGTAHGVFVRPPTARLRLV
jgi:hypothetical protein